METKEIIQQIENLPVEKRMLIIEQALKSIREKEIKGKMNKAVEDLQEEYKTNKDLTAFTEIDFENFYEPR
jgi:hypothetical protein